jgi:hypothetical protein
MGKFIVGTLVLFALTIADADARGGGRSNSAPRPYYGGGTHTTSHGGIYIGGSGSSHKGGTYSNPSSNDRYGIHQPPSAPLNILAPR